MKARSFLTEDSQHRSLVSFIHELRRDLTSNKPSVGRVVSVKGDQMVFLTNEEWEEYITPLKSTLTSFGIPVKQWDSLIRGMCWGMRVDLCPVRKTLNKVQRYGYGFKPIPHLPVDHKY